MMNGSSSSFIRKTVTLWTLIFTETPFHSLETQDVFTMMQLSEYGDDVQFLNDGIIEADETSFRHSVRQS